MAKRYGRSQRRQHREEIQSLRDKLAAEHFEHQVKVGSLRTSYRMALETAQRDALDAYLRAHPMLDDLLKDMTKRIADMLGSELMAHAKAIMDSGLQHARTAQMLELSARNVGSGDIAIRVKTSELRYTIEGHIGVMDYNAIPRKIL